MQVAFLIEPKDKSGEGHLQYVLLLLMLKANEFNAPRENFT